VRTYLAALLLVLLAAAAARAEPQVIASGAYPEGLLWHGGKLYFTELGADRVDVMVQGKPRPFWSLPHCGPTQMTPFGANGFIVNCHLGRAMVEVSADGRSGRRFLTDPDGRRLQDPNAAASDGAGGIFFSDSGAFAPNAPSTGRVYHLSAAGTMTPVVSGLHYANGVNFDAKLHTLYVSEHLARRVLALTLDAHHRVTGRRVLIDFAALPAAREHSYALGGPDGIALRPGLMAIAEYGEGRVHIFDRDGAYRTTVTVGIPFVDTVVWDDAGNLYAGGSFQNERPPFEGAVVRFVPSEWERKP
jgi:sugar lactone lactonase YvrE